MNFYPGIERIDSLNANVFINSNSCSKRAIELKRTQLQQILKIPAENYRFNFIRLGDHRPKNITANTFIFIDDSPYNLIKSDAIYNIALKKPYNTTEKVLKLIADHNKNVIFCDTLNNIIDTIEMLLKKG